MYKFIYEGGFVYIHATFITQFLKILFSNGIFHFFIRQKRLTRAEEPHEGCKLHENMQSMYEVPLRGNESAKAQEGASLR